MIPSYRWFPTSMPERVIWYKNFAFNFIQIAESFGLADKIPQVTADNKMMTFYGFAENVVINYLAAVRAHRKSITEGKRGKPIEDFPVLPVLTMPDGAGEQGIYARLDQLVAQIRTSDKFSNQIGSLLDIVPKRKEERSLADWQPEISAEAKAAQKIKIKFTRGRSSGLEVDMQLDGSEEWVYGGTYFKSPGELIITQEPDKPHHVRLRAQYLDGNHRVGSRSSIITVVTMP